MRLSHLVGVVFFLALVVRLVFVVQWHATPYGPLPLLDALAYDNWAQDIAQGHIAHGRAFYLMPLFPYVLGLLYAVFGHSLWVPSLFNAVIGAATCALLAELTFAAFGPLAAITTGILAALYKPFIFYTPSVMKETLGLFLLTLFVSFAYHALKTKTFRTFIWSGVFLGLCAIVRGNVLALAPVVIGFIFRSKKSLRLKNSVGFLAGIGTILLPIMLHNAIASGDFVLTSYADGFNAYIGHNPAATGTSYVFPPEVTSNPALEEFDITRIANIAQGYPLKPSEVSAWWWGQAVDYALANPGREWRLLTDKIAAFWSNDEPYDNYNMGFIEDHFSTVLSLPLSCFGLVACMAVFAAAASTRQQRKDIGFFVILIFVYMLTLIPFYVTDRYRLPVVVFLLPLAGAAVPIALKCIQKKKTEHLVAASLAAIVTLGLSLWSGHAEAEDDAFNWSVLCTVYEDEGYHVASIMALNQAITIAPHKVGADAWIKTADAMDHLGRHKESEDLLEKTEKTYPRDGTIPYNFGRMKFMDGDYAAALIAFRKAIELTPTFMLSYRGLAAVYDHFGDRAKALETIRQGLAIVPTEPKLLEVLAAFQ